VEKEGIARLRVLWTPLGLRFPTFNSVRVEEVSPTMQLFELVLPYTQIAEISLTAFYACSWTWLIYRAANGKPVGRRCTG